MPLSQTPHQRTEDFARAVRILMWASAIGVAVCLTGWSLRVFGHLPAYVRHNSINFGRNERIAIAVNLGLGVLGGVASAVVILAFKRRSGLSAGLRFVERCVHRASPLLLAPLVPIFCRWSIWVDRELSHLLSVTLFGFTALGLWRLSLGTGAVIPERLQRGIARVTRGARTALAWPGLPPCLLFLGILGYTAYFSYFSISNHHNLQTLSYDLAIENNLMWNLVHGGPLFKTTPHDHGPLGSHMGFHHTYLSYVLAIFYVWWPRPETLLVIQPAFIAAAAWPLYLIARRRLSGFCALFVALAYLLYPPVHGANLYDFHYPPFMPFFMWFMLYFAERNRTVIALLFALLSISIREDAAACVALWGLYLILSRTHIRFGVGILVLGMFHFVVSKMILMPWVLGGEQAYAHQYQDLIPEGSTGFGGVLITVFGNPGYTLHTLFREPIKLVYALQIAAPLLFLPWRRPIGILLSLPGLFFTLLATYYDPMVQISFQYTFFWTTFIFIALVLNLDWVGHPRHDGDSGGRLRQISWALAITGVTLVCTFQYGAILQRQNVVGGFEHKPFGPDEKLRKQRDQLYRLIAMIPADAKVSSAERVTPHVSSRETAYTLRVGVFDADYIIYQFPLDGDERHHVQQAMRADKFGVVRREGPFVLLQRGFKKPLKVPIPRPKD